MIRRAFSLVATAILLAATIFAATQESVDGRWQGKVNTADGSLTVTFNFKSEGQVLTGTEKSAIFSRSISDGKVDGDKILFKTSVGGNSIEHKGTLKGDTILLKSHGPGGEFDMTLSRVSGDEKSAQQ